MKIKIRYWRRIRGIHWIFFLNHLVFADLGWFNYWCDGFAVTSAPENPAKAITLRRSVGAVLIKHCFSFGGRLYRASQSCERSKWCEVEVVFSNPTTDPVKYLPTPGLKSTELRISEELSAEVKLLALLLCSEMWGAAVAQWLRCCDTNWKVAGSIPVGVIGFFIDINPSDRTVALESTQPLTEMSTRSISWG